jgi:tetratricopeptide (TPR) repeat protein
MSTPHDTDALLQQSALALESRRYPEAEALQKKVVELLRRDSPADPRISGALEALAGVHFYQGKFGLAANEYEEALRLSEKDAPGNTPTIWRLLYWQGQSLFKNQNYEPAETALRRALSVAESLNDDQENFAASLHRLGFLLYFVGKYQQGEPYLLRALSLNESIYGVGNVATVDVLTTIAMTYENCADLGNDPEPFLRRAVENTKPVGDSFQAHTESLWRLAAMVARHGESEEADEIFTRLLALLKAAPSNKPPSQWVVRGCVEYFRSRGKEESVKEFISAVDNYDAYGELTQGRLSHAEQTLSEDDPEFADALFNSANNLLFNGKYDEAAAQLRRALVFYEKIQGENSLPVVTTLNRLCVVNRLLDNAEQAEAAISRALGIAKVNFPDKDIYARTLENLAVLKDAQSRKDEGMGSYAQATTEMERNCGFPSYETVEMLYRHGSYLCHIGEFSLAEVVIRRALSAIDDVEGLSSYEKSDYFLTLANVLNGLHRGTEADVAKRQAEDLFEEGKLEAAKD